MVGYLGVGRQPARRQDKGPWPKPRWLPQPRLLYAQGVKQSRRKRRAGVQDRGVVGPRGALAQGLAVCNWQSTPAWVERLLLIFASAWRRSAAGAIRGAGTPMAGRRRATNGGGAAKWGQPWPLALAVGVSDHGWPRPEGLLWRVPPWAHLHAG